MRKIRMIASDLDRTLLGGDRDISAYTAGVLKNCREKGILIAFATARPERATRRFQAVIEPDYVIANNGATLCRKGEVLEEALIPPGELRALMTALLAQSAVTSMTMEAGDCLYSNYEPAPEEWEPGWNPVYSDFSVLPTLASPKLSVECADSDLFGEFMASHPGLALVSNSGENWYQIVAAGRSKLRALERVAELNGLSLADVAAFGDDHNDVQMLGACGIGVAVDNAIDLAKDAAGYLCGRHDEDGVARWIEEYILG